MEESRSVVLLRVLPDEEERVHQRWQQGEDLVEFVGIADLEDPRRESADEGEVSLGVRDGLRSEGGTVGEGGEGVTDSRDFQFDVHERGEVRRTVPREILEHVLDEGRVQLDEQIVQLVDPRRPELHLILDGMMFACVERRLQFFLQQLLNESLC